MLGEESISRFRNTAATRPSFSRDGIHPIVSMMFHPHEMVLGVGATDAKLNVGLSFFYRYGARNLKRLPLQIYHCQV